MKKLFSTCAVLAVTSLIIFSCKKSNTTTPASTTTSTTGAVTAPPNGFFTAWSIYDDNSLSGGSNASTGAATAQNISAVSIGTVTINGDTVANLGGGDYTTSASTATLAPFAGKPVWKITGANGFGAFSYTTTKSIPTVGNLQLSQSSISKSVNLVLSHAQITADSITYTIDDGNSHQVKLVVTGSSTGCTFTVAMLSAMTNSNGISDASIEIIAQTLENSTQGTKNIYFANLASYTKSGIVIKN
jgi:VCBS repeat-containing protein